MYTKIRADWTLLRCTRSIHTLEPFHIREKRVKPKLAYLKRVQLEYDSKFDFDV